jgi:hypothetical protein
VDGEERAEGQPLGACEVIHYHGLPMTPIADMIKAMKAKHAMVSFEHPGQVAEAAEVCQSIVLDNGAFSAWRQKKAHDFEGYIEWAAQWTKHPAVDWCVIPDVIDGTEEENDALVYRWPLNPAYSVPVYHLHESLGRLARLMMSFPRIALGSSGEYQSPNTAKWWDRMAEVMRVVCDGDGMPRVKLHGLRMLDPDCFSRIPLASADSCNVARNIGIDKAWTGPYVPTSKWARAMVMIDRIESHASARRWSGETSFRNWELFG